MSILIVDNIVTASLSACLFSSKIRIFLSQSSSLIIALSLGFFSYYLYYLPSSRPTEYFVVVMLFAINGIAVAVFALVKQNHQESIILKAPPCSPVGSSANEAE